MKDLSFIRGYFAILFVAICAIVLYGCNQSCGPSYTNDGPDSVFVAEQVEMATNPSFSSIADIHLYQTNLNEKLSVEDEFCSMNKEVLTYASYACLKKKPSVTINDIVHEYRANKEIYDNLGELQEDKSKSTVEDKNKSTVADGQRLTIPDSATSKQSNNEGCGL